jgi:hypothetical protein
VRNKALKRQYHTLLDWERQSANPFCGLFGENFKLYMGQTVRRDAAYGAALADFLELGLDRNRLVHHYVSFTMEKTTEEIYAKYRTARNFAETFSTRPMNYLATASASPTAEPPLRVDAPEAVRPQS